MKLKDDFFEVLNVDKTEYSIRLNSGHSIYRDHFPGNPITPGVCILQMVKELVAENLACPLFLQKIAKVRYFKAINPVDNAEISISLNISGKEGAYNVSATVFSDDVVFSQLSLWYSTSHS
jgi:3-hydroxyacyl-[acyl-carrier-protein] dehydratase